MAENFDDRQIGKTAARKLSSSLRAKTSSFADHYNRPADQKSLKDAVAKPRLKQYGLVANGNKNYYLRAISIVMPQHGFIRHYGVNINRSAGSRKREKPKSTTYHFASHYMRQNPKPFLDQIIQSSGAVDYVAEKIAESRGEEIAQNLAISVSNFH